MKPQWMKQDAIFSFVSACQAANILDEGVQKLIFRALLAVHWLHLPEFAEQLPRCFAQREGGSDDLT
jgi:hypothetical protein